MKTWTATRQSTRAPGCARCAGRPEADTSAARLRPHHRLRPQQLLILAVALLPGPGAAASPDAQPAERAPIPGAAAPPIPPSLILNSNQGMGEGGRNGDVSGPTTPYARGDLGGLRGAVEAGATPTATLSATRRLKG